MLLDEAKEHKPTQILLQEIDNVETPGYIYGDNEDYIFWIITSKYQI